MVFALIASVVLNVIYSFMFYVIYKKLSVLGIISSKKRR